MKLITGRRNRVGGRSSIENAGNLHDIPSVKALEGVDLTLKKVKSER